MSSPADGLRLNMQAGGIMRRRIALVGHACSSAHGSEPSFTWNWAINLAKHHDVVVFAHPQYRSFVEKTGYAGMRIVWVEPKHRLDPWKPEKGERGIRIHYGIWQKHVVTEVAREHALTPFDLVHHVSWGSLNQPPALWKLPIPFVWGPIGGGQTWPSQLLHRSQSAMKERLRSFAVRASNFNPAIRRAMRHAELVLATNPETAAIARHMGAKRVEMLLDAGTPQSAIEAPAPEAKHGNEVTFLWAGRIEARKGLPLAIEAIAKVSNAHVRLVIAGDGPDQQACIDLAGKLHVTDRVSFVGRVPFEKMRELFAQSDAFVFTSMRDSVGSVLLEAMSARLPILTLDHQGASFLVTDQAGIKVPVTTEQDIIEGIASGMEQLANDVELRRRLSRGAYDRAVENAWTGRAERMSNWYEDVLNAHRIV